MEKKESYKHALPHFQQPRQTYFVTWSLKDAVPKKALERYTNQLELLGDAISNGCGDFQSQDLKSAIENRATQDASPDLEKTSDAILFSQKEIHQSLRRFT